MAKKDRMKNTPSSGMGYRCATLREESTGMKHVKGFKNVNSILKMQHLQKLATWASRETSIPPLGALFGHHLAASAEAMGIPLDSSLFSCQRCETILLPGSNCTVRVEKNKAKFRRCKKPSILTQNNVVYTCHFCSHRNLKKGTPKGHMKEILAERAEPIPDSKSNSSRDSKSTVSEKDSEAKSNTPKEDSATKDIIIEKSPMTPVERKEILPPEEKRTGCRFDPNKSLRTNASSTMTDTDKSSDRSGKRRRKGWSSLEKIAESSEQETIRNLSNLTVPFFL